MSNMSNNRSGNNRSSNSRSGNNRSGNSWSHDDLSPANRAAGTAGDFSAGAGADGSGAWFVEDFQLRSPFDEFAQLAQEVMENLGEADVRKARTCRKAVELVASRLGGEEGHVQ